MHGRILLANPAAERGYAVPVSKLLGRDVRTLYPEGVAPSPMKTTAMRTIKAGKSIKTVILESFK